MDAAERLLVEFGHEGVTTRRLAEEANLNHGLVHYYFGSMENLLARVLERFTDRMIVRQRALYAADAPFIEKWRTAMRYLDDDREYQKVWFELQSLAWSRPDLRERVAQVNAEWRAVLTEAFAEPLERYGLPIPLDALVSLVATFNEGIILERLSGIDDGQAALLAWIDEFLEAAGGEAVTTTVVQPREQSRARYPDEEGHVERDGVRTFYEVYGDGPATIMLLPTWSLVHSRIWKAQIPYLSRHFRVVTLDGRGNGRSDRPQGIEAYDPAQFALDALAVLDRTGTDSASLVAFSRGALWATVLAAEQPERVSRVAYLGPSVPLSPGTRAAGDPQALRRAARGPHRLGEVQPPLLAERAGAVPRLPPVLLRADVQRAALDQADRGRRRLGPGDRPVHARGHEHGGGALGAGAVLRVRRARLLPEPGHPRRQRHDLPALRRRPARGDRRRRVRDDRGGGHAVHARDPVRINHLLHDFSADDASGRRCAIGCARSPVRRRALYVSSPIGLGHARRDVAIARELRRLVPDLEIDWLAQDPVTRVLEAEGERIHPASADLANESGHIESESAEHDLHAFQAIRRMDEILCANFMVFDDLVTDQAYDLWIGDEAWEIDYFLHENPERKRAAYVWLTDFVGWLPMPDGGEREAFLTADYNAEMIEQIARFPRVRDQALFVGNREDVVPESFGSDLPEIRAWTEEHFEFPGYVSGFDPAEFADREKLRAELGYAPGELVCIVTVGGSGVGEALLRRVIEAFPIAKGLLPELRMIVVAGPGSIRPGCPPPPGSRCAPTSTTSTSTSPRATWPWSRAG